MITYFVSISIPIHNLNIKQKSTPCVSIKIRHQINICNNLNTSNISINIYLLQQRTSQSERKAAQHNKSTPEQIPIGRIDIKHC